ncbi:MAG: hypothetical protein COB67_02165 [SAR324 cluster bacterium]|uniref:Outer membrane lipoprotein BamD-like domain-containing protein n=1 Tax=SAR324 cluster bacterium TaxID=2024889 RepID=A0A2A4TAC0_9DELT|nr:MAG: hypothetical protein COB67_02165 [SAR324 cluster bacterium]
MKAQRKTFWWRGVKLFYLLCAGILVLSSCQKDGGQKIFNDALELVEDKKYDEAIQNFITLTKAFPNDALVDDSLFWIANIYEHYLKNPKQGIRFYRSLNKKFTQSEYYYQSMIGLARVYTSLDNSEKRKAVRIYQRLKRLELPKQEKAKNQYQLASLLFNLKQFDRSRAELKSLILEYKDTEYTAKAFHLIGFSYYVEGKKQLAKITFREADQKFEYSRASLASAIGLADIYEEEDQLSAAIKVYKSILRRLEQKEVFFQLAQDRIAKLQSRLKKTNNG